MPKFDDLNTAARLRQAIKQIATDIVDEIRPRERFATVTAVNAKSVTILYPDELTNPITLPCIGGIQVGVGAVVRVNGKQGARYVDAVMGGPYMQLGRRNVLDNGTFQIAQRYTSASMLANYGFMMSPLDRWQYLVDRSGGATSGTVAQSVFSPNPGLFDGIVAPRSMSLNLAPTTGGTYNFFRQRVEDVNTLAGQVCTFSVWVLFQSTAGNLLTNILQNYGTGGSPAATNNASTKTTAVPFNTWTKITQTFTMPSVSGKVLGTNNDHGLLVDINFPLNTASTQSYYLWGAQLEAGPVATPIEVRTYGDELASCQRHLYAQGGDSTYQSFGFGFAPSTATMFALVALPVTMRASPTPSMLGALRVESSGFAVGVSSVAGDVYRYSRQFQTVSVAVASSTLTVDRPYTLQGNNDINARLVLSAEVLG